MPAFPVAEVVDPTGAGDTFAGGFFGYLSQHSNENLSFEHLKNACVHGCVLASFSVEDFSVRRLLPLLKSDIETRLKSYLSITTLQN